MRYVLVSIGAVAGANARLLVGDLVLRTVPSVFPYGTLLINVTGSVLLGAFVAFEAARLPGTTSWRMLVAVGFCGAYTTFSTFSLEAWTLFQERAYAAAATYIAASVVLAIAGFAAGAAAAGALARA